MTHPILPRVLTLGALSFPISADVHGADDTWPPIPRRVPPPGVKIDDVTRAEIDAGLAKLQGRLKSFKGGADAAAFLPDVQIYEKAVRYALLHGEFFKPEQAKT